MAKALFASGLTFWIVGLACLLPTLLDASGPISVGSTTIEKAEPTLEALFAASSMATIGSALLVSGAIFFCAGAIVSHLRRANGE